MPDARLDKAAVLPVPGCLAARAESARRARLHSGMSSISVGRCWPPPDGDVAVDVDVAVVAEAEAEDEAEDEDEDEDEDEAAIPRAASARAAWANG